MKANINWSRRRNNSYLGHKNQFIGLLEVVRTNHIAVTVTAIHLLLTGLEMSNVSIASVICDFLRSTAVFGTNLFVQYRASHEITRFMYFDLQY